MFLPTGNLFPFIAARHATTVARLTDSLIAGSAAQMAFGLPSQPDSGAEGGNMHE